MSTLAANNITDAAGTGGPTLANGLTIGTSPLAAPSGSAPSYTCRAWVNFDGTANSNLTGTYSQSGTAMTITVTNHGFSQGQSVYITFQTGAAGAELFTVTSVTNANVFVVTSVTSRTTSGNCTLVLNTIRGSGNVSSITDNGTGDYTVNFTTALADANYATQISTWYGSDSLNTLVAGCGLKRGQAPTTTTVRVQTAIALWTNSGVGADLAGIYVSIFR